jgi:hypothetical protein
MPITGTSAPAIISSVADNIEYELTITPSTVLDFYGNQTVLFTTGSTPYGLTIFERIVSAALPAAQQPTFSVGSIIQITNNNIYKGSHVIVEVIDDNTCIVNTIYKGSLGSLEYDIFNDFNVELYEFSNLGIGTAINTIATLKGIPKNDKIVYNVSEYLRGVLGDSKRSIMFGIGQSGLSLYGRSCAVNSALTLYKINSLFAVNATTVETASTLIFFKGFKTFVSKTLVDDTFLNEKRAVNDFTVFTMGSTYSGTILESQKVEVNDGCFKDALNIVYVNQAGGLRNYVVYNDIGISLDFDNDTTFKDSNLNVKSIQNQSFKSYAVSTENIRTSHAETIEQMIASPFTWLEVNGTLIPIVIEKQSILLYRSYNEAINLSFNFRLSETIQSQVY